MFSQTGTEARKRHEHPRASRARWGGGRADWIFQTIEELRSETFGDRIGVWFDDPIGLDGTSGGRFRGEVWESGSGHEVLEWAQLAVDVPLRVETLRAGLSCEYEITEPKAGPCVGAELQLRRVLWVPVMVRRALRGLVMVGSLDRKRVLPCGKVERIADKLQLLLELEEERNLAAARKADVDFWLRMKRLLSGEQNTNMILGQLAESCTRGEATGGVGALFVLIGQRRKEPASSGTASGRPEEHLVVRTQSGDSTWAYGVNRGPLEALWRRAVTSGQVAVETPGSLPLAKDIARFVGIPVDEGSEVEGVLIAGLPRSRAVMATLERLKWRAALAAEVFQQERWNELSLKQHCGRKAELQWSAARPANVARADDLALLGQHATCILHELKNPLTTILGNAQRLAHRVNGNGSWEEVAVILQEAERASGIVRHLLDLPGEATAKLQEVRLNKIVESTAELQRNSFEEAHLRLETELEDALPAVLGDPAQLQQVVLNLLQNAQQAIEESAVGSRVIVRTRGEEAGRAVLEVEDDGPGIPETIRPHIFDPFFTTKPAGKGTGLGLAIASGFVHQHRGTLRVFSTPKGGTRFVVELPAMEAGRQETVQIKEGEGELGVPSRQAASQRNDVPRILVIEDEPTVGALIRDVLREEGLEVDVVTDGRPALERAQHVRYDLAICDWKMPEMDGQAFFEALQRTNCTLREHVLFVTGDEVTARTEEFLVRYRLPHVAKPFRVEELCLAVQQLLEGKSQVGGTWGASGGKMVLGTGRTKEGNGKGTD